METVMDFFYPIISKWCNDFKKGGKRCTLMQVWIKAVHPLHCTQALMAVHHIIWKACIWNDKLICRILYLMGSGSVPEHSSNNFELKTCKSALPFFLAGRYIANIAQHLVIPKENHDKGCYYFSLPDKEFLFSSNSTIIVGCLSLTHVKLFKANWNAN